MISKPDEAAVTERTLQILFLTGSVSRQAGGVFDCVRGIALPLHQRGVGVRVLGLRDDATDDDLPRWSPVPVDALAVTRPASFGFAPRLTKTLQDWQPDLIHIQGLWMYPSLANWRWSTRNRRPYVVSPQGMLDHWALANSRWKKRIVATLYEKRHLSAAACIHALSESEVRAIRAYGLNNPIALIPNGVYLQDRVSSTTPPVWTGAIPEDRRVLLFLSRIHPKKGLLNLVDAWAELAKRSPDLVRPWHLVLAGWGQGGHEQVVARRIEEHGLGDRILMPGPLHGDAKEAALSSADAFVLPSHSEGLPVAVLEAWDHCLPVAMTPECNILEGFREEAAVELGTDVAGVVRGLTQFLQLDEEQRRQMGARGRHLVEQKFNWNVISDQFLQVYRWTLGQADRPEFVLTA